MLEPTFDDPFSFIYFLRIIFTGLCILCPFVHFVYFYLCVGICVFAFVSSYFLIQSYSPGSVTEVHCQVFHLTVDLWLAACVAGWTKYTILILKQQTVNANYTIMAVQKY